ncbi:SDR family oxidoreductase [Priestia flexa]|uniref:SDR family oxidoreductase n=1 Tax=Priestia flexa TaxID=86664 RepID=UPI0013D119AC|nr:SDR family oxidoreductase [Priestia flexa]
MSQFPEFKEQTVLITGTSSGFGLLSAYHLAKAGYNIIASMRNLEKKSALLRMLEKDKLKERVTFVELDVTSQRSVDQLTAFLDKGNGVDVLINNAGFAFGGFSEEIHIDEYKEQFETNVFGVMRVTQAVLPFMREKRRGKIINISSISGLIGFPGLSPYVSSKHALEGYSESLRLELKPFGIDVALIEPGSYATNIWTTGKKISKHSLNEGSPYHAYMRAIENELQAGEKNLGDPDQVVSLLLSLCNQSQIKKLRYPVGKGVKLSISVKRMLPWNVWERVIIKKLLK